MDVQNKKDNNNHKTKHSLNKTEKKKKQPCPNDTSYRSAFKYKLGSVACNNSTCTSLFCLCFAQGLTV